MAAHDWTKVSAGIFHHFHATWIPEIAMSLNAGLLPPQFYALAEQVTSEVYPDVIALEVDDEDRTPAHQPAAARAGAAGERAARAATTLPPPKTYLTSRTENVTYASVHKTVSIRHAEGHQVVALIEVLSSANKASRSELEAFLRKAQSALKRGIHLLVVDLYPPGRLDPHGVHGELWAALGQAPQELPADRPLLAVSYESGEEVTAYVEPFRVGDPLPAMPVFLAAGFYVELPLEPTYERAFEAVPAFWRERIVR